MTPNKMFNKYHFQIVLLIILLTGLASLVLAGPVSDKDITFNFQIPSEILTAGEWKIYLVSIGEFEKDGWKFDNYSNTILDNYINFKKNCGSDNTFYETT